MVKLTILLMSHHQQRYRGNPLAVENHGKNYNSITVSPSTQYLGNPLAVQNHGKIYTYNTITVSPSTTISWQSFGSAKSW
jgi:hypothetical protein